MIQVTSTAQTLASPHETALNSGSPERGSFAGNGAERGAKGFFAKLVGALSGKGESGETLITEEAQLSAAETALEQDALFRLFPMYMNPDTISEIQSELQDSEAFNAELHGIDSGETFAERAVNRAENAASYASAMPFLDNADLHGALQQGEMNAFLTQSRQGQTIPSLDDPFPDDPIPEDQLPEGAEKALSALNPASDAASPDAASTAAATTSTATSASSRAAANDKNAAYEKALYSEAELRAELSKRERGEWDDAKPSGNPSVEGESKKLQGQLKIDVQDLRTDKADRKETTAVHTASFETYGDHTDVELSVNLNLHPSDLDTASSVKNGRETSASRLFESALSRELRGDLSSDIVKNAALIVRNGGEGTIRLALHPDTLGHVKVHIEMTENKLMGRIVVESSEALRAFERELPVLEKAFRDSGFTETSLDMSLAQDGSEYSGDQDEGYPAFEMASLYDVSSSYDTSYDNDAELSALDTMIIKDAASLSAHPERKTINVFV